ncbi:MAG: bifunctional glutamate N-acetyltransferase/amino-acid acetyltransferase ArgJ [Ilumatobacteraceae bacterium]|nr:bifunctional glutamate N-acetyltransferase/amino-acid acetyltransferase ArgJ [Ilumatobacteraceae bacterium]
MTTSLPEGFSAYVANVGVKDDTDDFTVVFARGKPTSAAVFTQSRFAGSSVIVSRPRRGKAHAIVVISKNANVATGQQGLSDSTEITHLVAQRLGIDDDNVLIASTGVIGRALPMDLIRSGIAAMQGHNTTDADNVARGIMTTDTVPKIASATISGSTARVVGVAKGVGMIEPNMATLIAMVFTDAAIDASALDSILRSTVDRTLNCLSIDTDTSTSDTTIILSSGIIESVGHEAFEVALHEVLVSLTQQIARDGEGAEKLIEVTVDGGRDNAQAKRVAKSIVNSPLVKTAVHGADPNWGRVAMAIGKCSDDTDILQENVVIRFGNQEVYPNAVNADGLERLSVYMRGDTVRIHVSLNISGATATVWGCDLTSGYVRINADYTT